MNRIGIGEFLIEVIDPGEKALLGVGVERAVFVARHSGCDVSNPDSIGGRLAFYVHLLEVNSTSFASLSRAAPESSDSAAIGIASDMESARPATTNAAAALSNTTSRRGDFSPSTIRRMISAFAFVSPPWI